MKRDGYFPLLGFRKAVLWLLAGLVLCLPLCGCVSKVIYRDAAESGWKRWDSDHKPVVTDEAYNAMSEDERKNVMPKGVYDAREFEKREALGLLKD